MFLSHSFFSGPPADLKAAARVAQNPVLDQNPEVGPETRRSPKRGAEKNPSPDLEPVVGPEADREGLKMGENEVALLLKTRKRTETRKKGRLKVAQGVPEVNPEVRSDDLLKVRQ